MTVEDQLDRGTSRIGGVEKLEEFNELAAAMAILGQSVDQQSIPGSRLTVPWRLYS